MAETYQPENIAVEKVNLADLLNTRREQTLQDNLAAIRFRPLAAKAEKHQEKIDKLTTTLSKLKDKINKGNKKINKWNANIADARKTQAYCEQLLATHALTKPLQMFFQGLLDRHKGKIERFQEKIKQKQDKIKKFTNKRTKCQNKIAKRQAKIDKIAGIDRLIENMGTAQGRRENFMKMLTDMRKSSLDKKIKKVVLIENRIAKKELALSKTATETEKVKLPQQIDRLKEQRDKLEGKINQLQVMAEKLDAFSLMSEQDADKVMNTAIEGAKATFEYDDYDLDDVFVVEADKAFGYYQIQQELSDEDKIVIAKLKNEVNIDRLYYGEVTAVTLKHIQQAGFGFDGNLTFSKMEPAQEAQDNFEMYYQPDEPDRTNESETSESEQQAEPKPESQTNQNQPQQEEHGTVQKATQGDGQTAGAGKQSELVKFSGLSGTHIQALKDSEIKFWGKTEPENTFSAFVHRSDAEQAKGVLSSVPQAQKKTASPFKQPHRKM